MSAIKKSSGANALTPASSTTNSLPRPAVQLSRTAPCLPCVRSEDLIGKDREIMIEHSGVFYRLRLTRANKLILTK